MFKHDLIDRTSVLMGKEKDPFDSYDYQLEIQKKYGLNVIYFFLLGDYGVNDKNHPSTDSLPATWTRTDEWYNFKNFNSKVTVLIKADETSYQGGKMNNNHPVSWYHEYDGGKAFYTALGHTKECFVDPMFLKHLWAGMEWAMK